MRHFLAFAGIAAALIWSTPGHAAGDAHATTPQRHWSFDGLFGTFDHAAVQRGFQVYSGVCAACHAMKLVHYRNLGDIGFSRDKVKEIAAAVEVTDGPNDQGEMFQRPGRASDRFKSPFANEPAARTANNGAYPPDLSLITKARVDGPNYIYALLTGYRDAPADVQLRQGLHYNEYFSAGNRQIAMPPPLQEDGVQYEDGTKATIEQMAADVTTFLSWAAEPELEARKRLGIKVILFLFLLTGMFYAFKVKIWKQIKH
jgi:ubiquinol-cytochrome c reductase cytochrome c1 subunit